MIKTTALLAASALISSLMIAPTASAEDNNEQDQQNMEMENKFPNNSTMDHSHIDALFNHLEQQYPEFFPSHAESSDVIGYYARYYPGSNMYLGTKDNQLYAYGEQFGGLLEAGGLESWLSDLPTTSKFSTELLTQNPWYASLRDGDCKAKFVFNNNGTGVVDFGEKNNFTYLINDNGDVTLTSDNHNNTFEIISIEAGHINYIERDPSSTATFEETDSLLFNSYSAAINYAKAQGNSNCSQYLPE